MAKRAGQRLTTGSSLSPETKDFISVLESSDTEPNFSQLSELYDADPVAYSVIDKINRNWMPQAQEFTDAEKSKFDSMRTKKDYLLYRGDSRYDSTNTNVGDTLDFNKKATFTSRNPAHSEYFNQKAIIVFEKGTKSLRRQFDKAETSEMIRGNFTVTRVTNDRIYVKQK